MILLTIIMSLFTIVLAMYLTALFKIEQKYKDIFLTLCEDSLQAQTLTKEDATAVKRMIASLDTGLDRKIVSRAISLAIKDLKQGNVRKTPKIGSVEMEDIVTIYAIAVLASMPLQLPRLIHALIFKAMLITANNYILGFSQKSALGQNTAIG